MRRSLLERGYSEAVIGAAVHHYTLAFVIRERRLSHIDAIVHAAILTMAQTRWATMPFLRRFVSVAREAHLEAPDPHRPIPLYDPDGTARGTNRGFRRRLRDRIEDLFQDACVSGDLATAEELLNVLENAQRRRTPSAGERRIEDASFARAREELARRKRVAEQRKGGA